MDGDEFLLKGIQFLGTPFAGSLVADAAQPFVDALSTVNPWPVNAGLLAALTNKNPNLADIVDKFRRVQDERAISLWIGCETDPTAGKMVTSREPATAGFEQIANIATINANHTSMVRYDRVNPDYMRISLGLVKMIHGSQIETGRGIRARSETLVASHRSSVYDVQSERSPSTTTMPSGSFSNGSHASAISTTAKVQSPEVQYAMRRQESAQSSARGPELGAESSQSLKAVSAPTPRDGSKLAKLSRYDIVFVIDDTSSMTMPADGVSRRGSVPSSRYTDRWSILEHCLQAVVDVAASHDSDGVDVRFLKCGKDIFRGSYTFDQDNLRRGQDILDRLVSIRSMLDTPRCEGGTFFTDTLYELLSERTDRWKEHASLRDNYKRDDMPRYLNIIAVTDGAENDQESVQWAIANAAKVLDKCDAPPRCIGVQFVQIGDDAAATAWLKQLDDDLGREEHRFRDMVDTKPWDPENIEAILLGAIVTQEDNAKPRF